MGASTLPKSFDDLIGQSEKPVLVDFWAAWCGACRALAPSVKRAAEEFSGRLTVIKVDVDRKPQLASRYDVSGIPTLILFYRGRAILRSSGALPYDALREKLDDALSAAGA